MNIKKLIAALLALLVCGIGLDMIVRLNAAKERPLQTAENRALRRPISAMLRDMTKHGRRITEDDAKAVSLEIWKELWDLGSKVEVESCEWDEQAGVWTVSVVIVDLNSNAIVSPSGCVITITDLGYLDKVQYCGGM